MSDKDYNPFFERAFYWILIGSSIVGVIFQSVIMTEPIMGVLGGSYLMNAILAGVIYGVIYKLRKKHSEKLGFIFLGGSGLKFAVFFLFLYPIFTADGEMSNREFAIFFIPYALTTALETTSLVKALNRA
jgi:hypothetical protein